MIFKRILAAITLILVVGAIVLLRKKANNQTSPEKVKTTINQPR